MNGISKRMVVELITHTHDKKPEIGETKNRFTAGDAYEYCEGTGPPGNATKLSPGERFHWRVPL